MNPWALMERYGAWIDAPDTFGRCVWRLFWPQTVFIVGGTVVLSVVADALGLL